MANEMNANRVKVVRLYTKRRVEENDDHDQAIFYVLHEIRACTEIQVRDWCAEAKEQIDAVDAEADAQPADDAQDDLETASAPEEGGWKFDAAVSDAFDDMLQRSIPNYEDMRRVTTDAALWCLKDARGRFSSRPVAVDLGASRGTGLEPLIDNFGVYGKYLAVETAEPMLQILRDRFSGWIDQDIVKVMDHDLREGYPVQNMGGPATVVMSVLTLQFVPIEYRQMILRQIYEQLHPGGALVLTEKVLGETHESQRLLVDLYWKMKRDNGYEKEAVERKALALEGVLVPLTASINEAWLRAAGFDLVENIWSYYNFRTWLAVKR